MTSSSRPRKNSPRGDRLSRSLLGQLSSLALSHKCSDGPHDSRHGDNTERRFDGTEQLIERGGGGLLSGVSDGAQMRMISPSKDATRALFPLVTMARSSLLNQLQGGASVSKPL